MTTSSVAEEPPAPPAVEKTYVEFIGAAPHLGAFSADGSHYLYAEPSVAGSTANHLFAIDADSGKRTDLGTLVAHITRPNERRLPPSMHPIGATRDLQYIFVACDDSGLWKWHRPSGRLEELCAAGDSSGCTVVPGSSQDGKYLAAIQPRKLINILDAQDGRVLENVSLLESGEWIQKPQWFGGLLSHGHLTITWPGKSRCHYDLIRPGEKSEDYQCLGLVSGRSDAMLVAHFASVEQVGIPHGKRNEVAAIRNHLGEICEWSYDSTADRLIAISGKEQGKDLVIKAHRFASSGKPSSKPLEINLNPAWRRLQEATRIDEITEDFGRKPTLQNPRIQILGQKGETLAVAVHREVHYGIYGKVRTATLIIDVTTGAVRGSQNPPLQWHTSGEYTYRTERFYSAGSPDRSTVAVQNGDVIRLYQLR